MAEILKKSYRLSIFDVLVGAHVGRSCLCTCVMTSPLTMVGYLVYSSSSAADRLTSRKPLNTAETKNYAIIFGSRYILFGRTMSSIVSLYNANKPAIGDYKDCMKSSHYSSVGKLKHWQTPKHHLDNTSSLKQYKLWISFEATAGKYKYTGSPPT